jgi:uncharacterized RDD family membrane protein YckC
VQQQWMSAPPGSVPGFGAPGIGQRPGPLAGFGARVLSFLIDILAPSIAFAAVWVSAAASAPETNYGPFVSAFVIPDILVLITFAVWNSGYRQGTTGQSIGRRVTKTKLVKIETGEPIGFGMALLRQICVAVTLGIGFVTVGIGFLIGLLNYLRPLWDSKRQTVVDKIVKAVVVRIDDATA